MVAIVPVYLVSLAYAVTEASILSPVSRVASLVSVNVAVPEPLLGICTFGTFEYVTPLITTFCAMFTSYDTVSTDPFHVINP